VALPEEDETAEGVLLEICSSTATAIPTVRQKRRREHGGIASLYWIGELFEKASCQTLRILEKVLRTSLRLSAVMCLISMSRVFMTLEQERFCHIQN
jgi:hypothetical protein